jgi:HAD superfamily hydrolase (TIGR01450 family)
VRLADLFDAFLIDLDGVVWRGDEPIEGAAETIAALREADKRVVFVTNNASRTARDYAVKLMRMAVPTDPSDVVTSGHVVVDQLHSLGLERGDRIHVCGARGLWQLLDTNGFATTRDTEDVSALVVAWNPDLVMDDIRRAADVARSGVPFIGANRDATYPSSNGLLPGSGAILAAIETASGRTATVVGKPEPGLFRRALERADVEARRALFVGDRPSSDVAGAKAAGIPVALVLTGVTSEEDLPSIAHTPDHVLPSITGLLDERQEPSPVVGDGSGDLVTPPAPEGDDQEEPGDEPADVGEERHAARLFGDT